MLRFIAVLAFFFLLIADAYALDGQLPLQLIQKISLTGVRGRIDHMAVDTKTNRLFIAALGNNTVEAVDLKDGSLIKSIKGNEEPQGIAFVPELNKIFVSSGGDGSCKVYDSRSLGLLDSIRLGGDADNIRYDGSTKRIFVGYGKGAIGIIDAATNQRMGDIPLGGHPESFQPERTTHRIFANIPSAGHVAVIDMTRMSVIEKWAVKGLNFPMALVEARQHLLIVTRRPSKLIILDTRTGHTISELKCVEDADDVYYDSVRGRIYVSGGEGFIDVFGRADAGNYQNIARILTAPGARTSLWVPELDRLFVAVPASVRGNAAIWVFEATKP
jgi:hypothetical protein